MICFHGLALFTVLLVLLSCGKGSSEADGKTTFKRLEAEMTRAEAGLTGRSSDCAGL